MIWFDDMEVTLHTTVIRCVCSIWVHASFAPNTIACSNVSRVYSAGISQLLSLIFAYSIPRKYHSWWLVGSILVPQKTNHTSTCRSRRHCQLLSSLCAAWFFWIAKMESVHYCPFFLAYNACIFMCWASVYHFISLIIGMTWFMWKCPSSPILQLPINFNACAVVFSCPRINNLSVYKSTCIPMILYCAILLVGV